MSEETATPGIVLRRFLISSANWCGMLLATLVAGARAFGVIEAYWLPMAIAAYIIGYQLGALLFGSPQLQDDALQGLLEPVPTGADSAAVRERLHQVLEVVGSNPGKRLTPDLAARLKALCEQIEEVLTHMESAQGLVSLEDRYSTNRLAIEYLPNLVHGYLTLPKSLASRKVLHQGKTAEQMFEQNLQVLTEKVEQLNDDLAAQDASAFLLHAQFLNEKYGARQNPLA